MARKNNGLSKQNIADIREVYDMFDRDGDGELTASELYRAISALQCNCGKPHAECACTENMITREQAAALLEQFDVDGDGALQFEEFLRAFEHRRRVLDPGVVRQTTLTQRILTLTTLTLTTLTLTRT
eukprot:TRINITY_DN15135_c0_g1_i2.p1 TRINITY_DN15135_c0_g1~~TRINITY_DN15135_c0_g1_i2.p1  ORF type:complete len:128 (+),score=29.89 TRINITY_DN15135_c0_g1_i2:199-582(+)